MTTEERIEELLAQMTLEEKVSMCSGADRWHTRRIDRLSIPALRMTDGPHGARTETGDATPITMPATCFPTGSALAATWNTELMQRVGVALADETKAKGCHILLGPAVNIQRAPLGGRNFEYYSEDPYLAGQMAVAWINGLQSQGVGASLKHFACNSSEFERMTISCEVDERALHEIYYPAFHTAVTETQPWTVMSSYNRVNGVSSAHNKPMLCDLLKDEWGFSGFVVSDWGGVYHRVAAANAGCDVEMPNKGNVQMQELLSAVKRDQVEESVIDDKVRRILRIIFRAGLFDAKKAPVPANTNTPERQELAREAAGEAMVLLKNKDGLLPLDVTSLTSIAVIGPAAEFAVIQGGGSAHVNPYYAVSAVDGLKKRCGDNIKFSYERGCAIDGSYPPFALDVTAEYFDNATLSGAPLATRSETAIGLSKELLPPGLDGTDFSVRWTGRLTATVAASYKFSLFGMGRSRILVDGKRVVNNWSTASPAPFTPPQSLAYGSIVLPADSTHTLTIEYSRNEEALYMLSAGCLIPGADDPLSRAVALAAASDVAIVCVGLPDRFESEGYDRPDMELTGDQVTLIKRVAAANKRTIVVLSNGSPVNMLPWIGRVGAVLEAWYAGQESGNAIAAILFGDVNPSGKLPTTFPRRLQDNPSYVNYPGENDKVRYGEGIFVGYRYYDQVDLAPLFPFGHGLSYTTFSYGHIALSSKTLASGAELSISVDVTNSGKRAGQEVVQLYVHDVESSLARPPKELKRFQKVSLKPDETKTVRFTLTERDLAFYDPAKKTWVAEAGTFRILAGSSSRDIRATATLTLRGDPALPTLSADSRLSEVLARHKGRAVLRKHLGNLMQFNWRWDVSYTINQLGLIRPERWSSELVAKISADLRKVK